MLSYFPVYFLWHEMVFSLCVNSGFSIFEHQFYISVVDTNESS